MEYAIKAPPLSEAAQTVTVLEYLKAEGDVVAKDELIMVLETDKASLEIESPIEGIIHKILHPAGSPVAVGETLLILVVEDKTSTQEQIPLTTSSSAEYVATQDVVELKALIAKTRNGTMSPKQKAYCLEKNVIPFSIAKTLLKEKPKTKQGEADYYIDVPLSHSQARLAKAFMESAQQVVQVNIQSLCDNVPIENFRKMARQALGDHLLPSRLEIISWAIVCALRNHPKFCSRLIKAATIRQFKNPSVGLALSLKNDDLTTAVVKNTFSLNFKELSRQLRVAIDDAKKSSYIPPYHSIVISDLSAAGIVNAMPLVTYPAVATLFVGKPYLRDGEKNLFNFSLSFDHRVINGSGAAAFLNDVTKSLKSIERLAA